MDFHSKDETNASVVSVRTEAYSKLDHGDHNFVWSLSYKKEMG